MAALSESVYGHPIIHTTQGKSWNVYWCPSATEYDWLSLTAGGVGLSKNSFGAGYWINHDDESTSSKITSHSRITFKIIHKRWNKILIQSYVIIGRDGGGGGGTGQQAGFISHSALFPNSAQILRFCNPCQSSGLQTKQQNLNTLFSDLDTDFERMSIVVTKAWSPLSV
jgi:hypothetical protein